MSEHYEKGIQISKLHEDDKRNLLPLPNTAFNPNKYIKVRINSYGRFTLNKGLHEYSVVPKLAGEYATVRITATSVHVLDNSFKELVSHDRLYGDMHQSSVKWLPFLTNWP